MLTAGYSTAVTTRYATTIYAELSLDSARVLTYGKCFKLDLPTVASCNIYGSVLVPTLLEGKVARQARSQPGSVDLRTE